MVVARGWVVGEIDVGWISSFKMDNFKDLKDSMLIVVNNTVFYTE